METKKLDVHPLIAQHLQELVVDVELYIWDPVKAFHAMWLQQLEYGRVTRADEDATGAPSPASASFQQPQKKSAKEGQAYNILAKPGSRVCAAFNIGTCTDATPHHKDLHVCA